MTTLNITLNNATLVTLTAVAATTGMNIEAFIAAILTQQANAYEQGFKYYPIANTHVEALQGINCNEVVKQYVESISVEPVQAPAQFEYNPNYVCPFAKSEKIAKEEAEIMKNTQEVVSEELAPLFEEQIKEVDVTYELALLMNQYPNLTAQGEGHLVATKFMNIIRNDVTYLVQGIQYLQEIKGTDYLRATLNSSLMSLGGSMPEAKADVDAYHAEQVAKHEEELRIKQEQELAAIEAAKPVEVDATTLEVEDLLTMELFGGLIDNPKTVYTNLEVAFNDVPKMEEKEEETTKNEVQEVTKTEAEQLVSECPFECTLDDVVVEIEPEVKTETSQEDFEALLNQPFTW